MPFIEPTPKKNKPEDPCEKACCPPTTLDDIEYMEGRYGKSFRKEN